MTRTTISQTAQDGNLVLNPTDKFSVSVNAATLSGNTFTVVGAIALAQNVSPSDFVDERIRIYFGVQFLNAKGTMMSKTLVSQNVTITNSLEFTFEVTFEDTALTGALYEAGGMGVLTADAWARFSDTNAITTNNITGSLSEYSESVARQFSANAGRGVIRP